MDYSRTMIYAIATGCSHTAGVGNDINDCYVRILESHYKFQIENHGIPSGNAVETLQVIIDAVQRNPGPEFIIAQWPNPIRRSTWINGKKHLQNLNNRDQMFEILLRNGLENFHEPWVTSIVTANLLCKLAGIPIINIHLESTVDSKCLEVLAANNIKLHIDEKLPGLTWLFDSKAQDNLHHSPACHAAWAERIIGLIDENTTR